MNDISDMMKHCKYHIYADDGGKYDVMVDCVVRFNDDLAHIHRWSMSNGLFLNPNETKAVFICGPKWCSG
jgi:hypothetical protein